MKNKYKNSISRIHVSNELENKILDKTINNKKYKIPKLSYGICAFLLVCFLGASVMHAKEIKSFFRAVLLFENGENHNIGNMTYVNIKDTSKRSGENAIETTLKGMIKELGISVLASSRATNEMAYYTTAISNDNIGRVDIWYPDFIEYPLENKTITELEACLLKTNDISKCNSDENEYKTLVQKRKSVCQSVSFITKYADDGYIDAFRYGVDAVGGKIMKETYHIEKLDVDAIIYGVDWTNDRLTATFLYNDMLYSFIGSNMTYEEFIEILDSLE